MGARRRLLQLLFVWALIGLAAGTAAVRLVARVDEVDHVPVHFIQQPVWSEDESQLAYVQQTAAFGTARPDPTLVVSELWKADRQGGAPTRIADLPAGHYRVTRWLSGGRSILILVDGTTDDPHAMVYDSTSGKSTEIAYQGKSLKMAGIAPNGLYLSGNVKEAGWNLPAIVASPTPDASPTPQATPRRSEAVLYDWPADADQPRKILGIPYEDEAVTIESAVLSPDGKRLALVLEIGGERALWLCQADGSALTWSGIRVPAESMRVAWAPTSQGLVAATHSKGACGLYVNSNLSKETDYRKLRSTSGPLVAGVEPFWPRDQTYLLLHRGPEIYQFDPGTNQATPMQLPSLLEHQTRDLAVSPRGTWAAYVVAHEGQDELDCVSLSTRQKYVVVGTTDLNASRDQWWYVLGSGLRQAWGYWTTR